MGISGWQARKKSYNRTTCLKSDKTCPNQVISQLRAKMVPTSALHREKVLLGQLLPAAWKQRRNALGRSLRRTSMSGRGDRPGCQLSIQSSVQIHELYL